MTIEALLRRSGKEKEIVKEKSDKPDYYLQIDEMEIYFNWHEIYIKGKKVGLTSKEFEIIAYMAKHSGQVFTREQLFQRIWGEDYIGYSNTITIFVRKIREKREEVPSKPKYLLTVGGVGYKFYTH